MAYNPQTDCTHYKIYSAYYTETQGRVIQSKLATVCIPNYGPGNFLGKIIRALEKQQIREYIADYDNETGFLVDDFGDVVLYYEE